MDHRRNGNESLCYYSLGNYVSTQKNALSMLEGMAWLTFHVAEDGVSIERKTTGVIPLVCQYTSGPVRFENVYLLEEYTRRVGGLPRHPQLCRCGPSSGRPAKMERRDPR